MAKNISRKKTKIEKQIATSSTNKELYREILQLTKAKKISWYKSIDNTERIRYTLQGNDGYMIHLIHYKNRPRASEYEFYNFNGIYTYGECREMEKAIIDAGLKRPLTPAEYKRKQIEQQHQEEVEKKRKAEQRQQTRREELELRKQCWLSIKSEVQSHAYKWEMYALSLKGRAYKGVFENSVILLEVETVGQEGIAYFATYKNSKKPLTEDNGREFESSILSECTYASATRAIMCRKGTLAEAYRNYLLASNSSRKKCRQLYCSALFDELSMVLLKKYRLPNGAEKYGIEILAEGRTEKELAKIMGMEMPATVRCFKDSIKLFLKSIDKKKGGRIECEWLYKELIHEYTRNISEEGPFLSRKRVMYYSGKYNREIEKIEAVQKAAQETVFGRLPKREGKKNIPEKKVNIRDFVVRTSVLSCMYRNHNLINVDAVIKTVDHQGDIKDMIVPAGYCERCQKFFILEADYIHLVMLGELLCTVIDEENYKRNYKNDKYFEEISAWPEKSILNKCGYNVNKTDGLTTIERRKILANVIDQEVLSKIEIRSHLRKQIALHKRHLQAVDKWESNDDFVAAYNKGYYARYGVEKLRRI